MLSYVPRHCRHRFFRLYPPHQNRCLLHLLHAHSLLCLHSHSNQLRCPLRSSSLTEALASNLNVSPHLHTSSYTHHAQESTSTYPPSSSQHHTHFTPVSEHTTHSYSHDKTADMPAMRRKLSLSSMTGLPRTGTPLPLHLSATATPGSLSSPISIPELPPSAVEQEHGMPDRGSIMRGRKGARSPRGLPHTERCPDSPRAWYPHFSRAHPSIREATHRPPRHP